MSLSKAEPLTTAELRQVVIRLLSRRDYSRHELQQKLALKAASSVELEALLDNMTASGWQSDTRFTELFLRDRSQRYGPVRLRQELKQKGIEAGDVQLALDSLDVNWREHARTTLLRKYGKVPTDLQEKAKAYRFLAQRGFSAEHISAALNVSDDGV